MQNQSDPAKPLKDLLPKKRFFIGVDSDGAVFDSMTIKQRQCFCPWMIEYFGLAPVADAATECRDFADLFSKTRGANRHKTMARILTELLPNHPQTIERGFKVPPFKHYAEWVNNPNSILSDEGLKQAIEDSTDSAIKKELSIAFEWSRKVNESTAAVAKDIQPFQYVRRCLERIVKSADIVVVSTAPVETLKREWRQHDIAGYVRMVSGQEMGSKEQQLAISAKYAINCSLMIGDALSDFKAARKNNCLFYPINPGDELNSWERLLDEGVDRFFNGTYAGDYEAKLFAEFDAHLPENPPWKVI